MSLVAVALILMGIGFLGQVRAETSVIAQWTPDINYLGIFLGAADISGDNKEELVFQTYTMTADHQYLVIYEIGQGDPIWTSEEYYGITSAGFVDLDNGKKGLVFRAKVASDDNDGTIYVIGGEIQGINPPPEEVIPLSPMLGQNYPNPFNPSTAIPYELPQQAAVRIAIYNELGQLVRQVDLGGQTAGSHNFIWDGTSDSGSFVASGLYLFELKAGQWESRVKKAVLIR